MRVVEELNQTLHGLMAANSGLYVIGEDILDPYGGAFKVTRGLSDRYPDRVLTMPISEAGLVGFGLGMSMRGKQVIAEIMFGDFLALTLDQLLNHASKINWMFNEAISIPLIIRAPMGGGRGYGPTHSQSIEKHFCGMPGLTIFAVNQFASPGDLLKKAAAQQSPVLFIENKIMYSKLWEPDRVVLSQTPDVVILSYGGVGEACVRAAEHLRRSEEIVVNVNLIEQISPLQPDHVLHAVGTCKHIVAVEEGVEGWGFSAECARILMERGGGVSRYISVAAPSMPIPSSREWELQILPNERKIIDSILAGLST
jgi:pyruvate/2-oxoglutarate/acetoin dehydrogenase E1 component